MVSRMNFAAKAALVGLVLNVVLSQLLPMIGNTGLGVVDDMVKMFDHHRKTLVSSSLVVALAVYLSVVVARKM